MEALSAIWHCSHVLAVERYNGAFLENVFRRETTVTVLVSLETILARCVSDFRSDSTDASSISYSKPTCSEIVNQNP